MTRTHNHLGGHQGRCAMRVWDEQVDREIASKLGLPSVKGTSTVGAAVSTAEGSRRPPGAVARLGDIAQWAVLLASFLFLALALVARVTAGGGTQWMVVVSNSMAPALRTGDLVVVRPAARDEIKVGDIVTFVDAHNSQVLVTHRVIAIEASGASEASGTSEVGVTYRVKGDNNPVADPERVTYSRIIGKVAFRLPLAGYVVHAVQNRPSLALLGLLPSLAVLVLATGRRLATPDRGGRRPGRA